MPDTIGRLSLEPVPRADQLQLEIDALTELSEALQSGTAIEHVLPSVADKAASLVGAEDALISLLDDDGILRLALPHCEEDQEPATFDVGGHAYLVARNPRPIVVNDIATGPISDCDRDILRSHGITGFIAVPMVSRDRLIGVLHICQRADGRPYTETDADIVAAFAGQAAIAIDNAHLYAESREFAERLSALLEAATEMSSSVELDEILRRVCERARGLCHADTAAIVRLDASGTRLTTTEVAGYSPDRELRVRAMGPILLTDDAFCREALENGRVVHALDYQRDPRTIARNYKAVDDLRSATAVPLIFRDSRIGLLIVGWRGRPRQLHEQERELLETLTRLAAVAYENARLIGANSTRAQEFKTLFDLSVQAASEVDPQAVIRATTEAAKALLAADRASLRLYDARQDLLVPRHMSGYAPLIQASHLNRKPGHGTVGRAFVERRAIIRSEYDDDIDPRERPEQVGLKSNLSVPLMSRGRAIGVLNVGSMRARQFDTKDAELLQLFANQAALLIDNAQLLSDASAHAERLEALGRVAAMLNGSLELEQVLDAIVGAVGQLTLATFSVCFLVDEVKGDLYYAAGRGARRELWKNLRLRVGQGLVGHAAATGQPLRIPDIRADPRAVRTDLDESEGLRAVIYTPVTVRGRIIGVLGTGRSSPDSFSDADLQVMTALADHAATAITNARLYDRAESDLKHLNSLREVVESVSAELDLRPLLDKVVRHAVQLMGADGGTVSLIHPHTGEARLNSLYGLPSDLLDTIVPPDTGLVGQVLATRAPVSVDRYFDLPRPHEHPSLATVRAGVAVPIWWQDALIGVFALFTRDPERRFVQTDIDTLATFAKHAAIAITNARLYEESQRLAIAEERNRMAREIHDTLAQGLIGIILQLELAELDSGLSDSVRQRIGRSIQLARENLAEARRTMLDLRAAALEGRSLTQALERLVFDVGRELGVKAEFRGPPADERFSARIETAVYRIAQEAIANVRKHAGASRLDVELAPRDNHLNLTIQDDGRGFDPTNGRRETVSSGFGLRSMNERASLVGGRLTVASRPGGGTRVDLLVPMEGQVVVVP
ncbi:MAG: GAF domain-containing protein [Chloroflexota bacterium]|nr:MAG: GAF domain-containing protein [Chloroflexota bacterium]